MKILVVLSALLLVACEPAPAPDSGLDAQGADAAVADSSSEAASDVLPPHVDGGGID